MTRLFMASLALTFAICSAWVSPNTPPAPTRSDSSIIRPKSPPSHGRRDFLASLIVGSTTPWLFSSPASAAATASSQQQQEKDKANIVAGYKRLQYFLDNWEAETTVCNTGQETTFGDKCERTPVKVMEYLGFKSMNDPLFKAEVTMKRLKDIVPSDSEVDFYDAIDSFYQNAEEANSMAFVSSWGESNPGGGKDRIQLFIERAKKNVVASRDSLKKVMDILDLKP